MWLVLSLMFIMPLQAKTPDYIVKKVKNIPVITAGGGYMVKEVIHPKNDNINSGFSLAYIRLPQGKKTEPHILKSSSQAFYILKGKAILHIGKDKIEVSPGTAVYIAPGVVQWTENIGRGDFVFLCVVSPPWRASDEEVLKR